MGKTRPQTVPAKRPPTPDPRDVVCPHQHFKCDIIDRDILSRKQHLNMLSTPKGYRWIMMKGDAADDTKDQDDIMFHPCRVVKKKPGKTYVHNILAELWSLLTPEMVTRLKEMLMAEFGLTEEAAVDFICHSRHDTMQTAQRTPKKRKGGDGEGFDEEEEEEEDGNPPEDPTLPRLIIEPKLCDKSQFAVGIDPCHIREFSRIVSTKFSEYVVAMMCARRNNRHRRMAEVVLNGLCNLTGEKTTLDNPKNRFQKILTITSDRVALWLAQNMDDNDSKRDRRRKKEDEALKKKKLEKQKEQERRRKEKDKMNKEIEKNKKRKAQEEAEKEKQKQEEQERKKDEKEKRRQEIEKFREEDKKKKQEEQKKAKEEEEKKKQEKKEKQEKIKQKSTESRPTSKKPTTREDQKPTGRDQKSATTGRDQRPGTAGKDQKSATTGRDQRPGTAGNDQKSATTGRDQRPGTAGKDQKSATTGRDQRPGTAGREQKPGTAGRPTGRDQKPAGGDQTRQKPQQARTQQEQERRGNREPGAQDSDTGGSVSEDGRPSSTEGGSKPREGRPGSPESGADTATATTKADGGVSEDQTGPSRAATSPQSGAPALGTSEATREPGPTSNDETGGQVAGAQSAATKPPVGGSEDKTETKPISTAPGPGETISQDTGASGKAPVGPTSDETGQITGSGAQAGTQPATTQPGAAASEDGTQRKVGTTPQEPGEQTIRQPGEPGAPGAKPTGAASDDRVPTATDSQPGRQPAGQLAAADSKAAVEDRIIAVTTSQIGDTKPVPTPRQETLQDILNKELEKRIEPKDKETEEIIKEISAKTATWIDQNVKDAEIEYGSRDKLTSVSPVSQKPKGPLFVVRKIDPIRHTYDVRLATHTEAGQKIRAIRRKASGRNLPSSAPSDPSDPKMFAKWAVNASQMADDWGHWIDKTIQDAEDKAVQYQTKAKDGITDPEDEEDWNRFVEATTENALSWRRKKKSLDDAAKEWKVSVK